MKHSPKLWAIAFAVLVGFTGDDPLEEAVRYYRAGDYMKAISAYEQALGELPLQRDNIRFNIAQCWAAMNQLAKAQEIYNDIRQRLAPTEAAKALNNLALLAYRNQKLQEALELLHEALVLDPSNETARYNFELMLRKLPPPPPPEPPPPPPPPTPRNVPPKPQELGADKRSRAEQSRDEVVQGVEDLAKREQQYLQQLKRRSKARQRYSDGPDW